MLTLLEQKKKIEHGQRKSELVREGWKKSIAKTKTKSHKTSI